jgi:hypothetical protein
MRYYLGVVCLILGSWLIYLAVNHRKRVIAARERAEAAGNPQDIQKNLKHMGIAMMPFYAMYGAFASLLLIGGYFMSDMSQYISILDLLGMVVLAIAYSVFMVMRAAYSKLGLDMSRG